MRHHADRPSSASIAHEIYIRMMPDKRSQRTLLLLVIVALVVSTLVLLVKQADPERVQLLSDFLVVKQKQIVPPFNDMGSEPVLITQQFAHLDEYDTDSHFHESSDEPAPKPDVWSGV